MPKLKAKVIRIPHNVIFREPRSRKIEKTIERWATKGYRLQEMKDYRGGCALWNPGYTLLTFIADIADG